MLLVTAVGLTLASCQQQSSSEGPRPVTQELLTNTHYVPGINVAAPRFLWQFSAAGFEMQGLPDRIPPELLDALLGAGKSAAKIHGKWRLDRFNLILFDLSVDGNPINREVVLKAADFGEVRVSVPGSSEYYLFDSIPSEFK